MPLVDLATAFVAQRKLAGKDTPTEEVDKLLKSMGLTTVKAADVAARANTLATTNKENARKMVADANPELTAVLAANAMADRLTGALDEAVTMGAAINDPDLGRRVEKTVQQKRATALAAAIGFTAKEMLAEYPIDLAKGLLAVIESERTPEGMARLEEARKKREEQQKQAAEEAMSFPILSMSFPISSMSFGHAAHEVWANPPKPPLGRQTAS